MNEPTKWLNAYADLHGRVQKVIDRWRTEADRLDQEAADLSRDCRDADSARRQQDMRTLRRLAVELERTLGGEK